MGQAKANAASGSKPATDWTEHEHTAPPVDNEAQKVADGDTPRGPLVEQAGSEEIADQALDAVKRRAQSESSAQASGKQAAAHSPNSLKDRLAERLGYESYLAMYEASKRVESAESETPWFVTPDRHGKWFVWNDAQLEPENSFKSFEQAAQSIASHSHRPRSPK